MLYRPALALRLAAVVGVAQILCACGQDRTQAPSATSADDGQSLLFKPNAGVQDIMAYMIDPAADFLWGSVSTTVTEQGVEEKQPRTDEEWNEVRRQAIILAEATNLLLIDGRRVTREGKQLEDHGTPGNLTADEAEKAIAADRATFISFAHALHEVGEAMVAAADNKNPQGLVDAGETMDRLCEGCHLKFWYPGQKIPVFPDQAPETDQ
jgi:hypothetical protein